MKSFWVCAAPVVNLAAVSWWKIQNRPWQYCDLVFSTLNISWLWQFENWMLLFIFNRRLHDVFALLSSEQPKCPQLYIYSSADRVIPAKSVESFIEKQRKAGHEVRACDFLSSPHVDHFRNHPGLYTSQLTNFLEDCVLTCCKDS